MTRAEYVALHGCEPHDGECDREWFGTVRYPDGARSLRVALIARYSPGCLQLAGFPVMSASSGPKDYFGNQAHYALAASKADELVIVRASGPTFALLRKGAEWYDVGGERVDLHLAS